MALCLLVMTDLAALVSNLRGCQCCVRVFLCVCTYIGVCMYVYKSVCSGGMG